MKKVKTAIWAIIIAVVVILIVQNKEFFFMKHQFRLDFFVYKPNLPEFEVIYMFIGFFLAGLLLGGYFLIIDHIRLSKKVKALNTQVGSQLQEITKLENELKGYRGSAAINAPESSDPNAKTVVINPEEAPASEPSDKKG
jgi:hypothetical protein